MRHRIVLLLALFLILAAVPVYAGGNPEQKALEEPGAIQSGGFLSKAGWAGGAGLLILCCGIWLCRRRQKTETEEGDRYTLDTVLEGIDDPIFMVDRNLRLLWANGAAKNLYGNLEGRRCYEGLHGRSGPCDCHPCPSMQSLEDGKPREGERRVSTPEGDTRYFLCSSRVARRDSQGRATAVVEIARDVTAIRKAEEDLHLAKWANDSSIHPIGMMDLQGRLTYVNRACLDLWGYSTEEEILGKEIVDCLQNPLNARAVLEILRVREGWSGTLGGRKKDGTLFDVEIRAYLTRNAKGEPICLTGYFSDVTHKKKTEQEIRQLAYYDTLTGLPNRTLLTDTLETAIGHARRSKESMAVLLLDLDNFKQVNDSMGHAKGDQVLKATADRLSTKIRKGDILARWAGDEFVFILTDIAADSAAATFAEKILEHLTEHPFTVEERAVFVTASVGIAIFPQDGQDPDTLLQHADTAMYEAKHTGGNSHHFFSEKLHQKIIERHNLEGSLRRALREGEFFLVYQPQIDLRTNSIVGIEALVRWQDPEKGLISPSQFIPVAEQTGLVRPLGAWILRTACAQAVEWQRAGGPPLRIAVNISARQFQQPDLVEQIEQTLKETGLNAKLLELELTESVFMENFESAIEVLVDLKARGIQIAIDDFGTGYSSLSYLKNFPINRIKIAQEFVRDLLADPNDMAIVEATIAIAKSLGLQVLAEGVETRSQMEFLQSLGCFDMQGFYFASPMAGSRVAEMLGKKLVLPWLDLPGKQSSPRVCRI